MSWKENPKNVLLTVFDVKSNQICLYFGGIYILCHIYFHYLYFINTIFYIAGVLVH